METSGDSQNMWEDVGQVLGLLGYQGKPQISLQGTPFPLPAPNLISSHVPILCSL